MRSMRKTGGVAILCQLLSPLASTHGYLVSRVPSSSSAAHPRSAFAAGPAVYWRQTSPLSAITFSHHRPINRRHKQQQQRNRRVVLFFSSSSATDFQNVTDVADGSLLAAARVSPSPPQALGTSGDWSAYLDESKGLIYYFNPRTGESKWEPPEDADFSGIQMKISAAKKVEMRERLKSYLEERLNDSAAEFAGAIREVEQKRSVGEAAERLGVKKPQLELTKKPNGNLVSEWGEWKALVDDKRGMIYYFNKNTRTSSWERPVGFPDFKLSASKRIALEEQNKRYLEWHKDAAKVNVLGRGTVVISDATFDGGSREPADASTASTDSDTQSKPDPDATTKLSSNSNFVTGTNEREADKTSNVNQPPTLPIVQQGDWSAYFDIKSGLVFYFNEGTGETSWDPPFKDFPRIVMENTMPKVLDSGSGNISMERALGYIGVDEMAEALAWEEAKKKERARKAAKRADEAKAKEGLSTTARESGAEIVEMYESAKKAELKRLEQARKLLAEHQKTRDEAVAKLAERERLKQERSMAEEAAANEREAAAELAKQEKLKQERLEKERMEADEKRRIEAAAKLAVQEKLKQERIAAEEAAAKLAIHDKLEQERMEKERIEKERLDKEQLDEEERKRTEAAAKLAEEEKANQLRIAAVEEAAANEREAAAKHAIQEKLEQDRLEKERIKKELFQGQEKRKVEAELKQPVLPKEDPTFTAGTVETMVAPLKTSTLYDVLKCSPAASRTELKRSYLSLAKETHPDALLQIGLVNNDETERRFVEISQAWKILGDPMSRRRYDRELQAKGISSKAGNMFESWVMGAAKAMDEALAKAESDLANKRGDKP